MVCVQMNAEQMSQRAFMFATCAEHRLCRTGLLALTYHVRGK